jgi:NAD(P)-dependent dehydrogenase (short-subunit alcohol dehydrogenase family)
MADLFNLHDRTAMVTDASSGLGRHLAQALAVRGAAMTLAAWRTDVLEDAVGLIGGSARALLLDVTDAASVVLAFEAPFYIVVNNAGITYDGPALAMAEKRLARVIDTDLTGVFRVAEAAGKAMVAGGRGGRHHQRGIDPRAAGRGPYRRFCRGQGRRRPIDEGARARVGAA